MLSKAVASAVSVTLNPKTTSKFFGLKRVSFVSSDSLVFGGKNSSFNADGLKKSRSCSRMESFVTKASASAQPLKNADELIDSVETFIFDCDGELVILFTAYFFLVSWFSFCSDSAYVGFNLESWQWLMVIIFGIMRLSGILL